MPRDRRRKRSGQAKVDQTGTQSPRQEKPARVPGKPSGKRPGASPGVPWLKPAIFIMVGLGLLIPTVAILGPRQLATTPDSSSPTPAAVVTPSVSPTPRPTLTPTATATPRPTTTPTATATPEPTPTPITPGGTPLPTFTFGGRGPLVTAKMELSQGLALFTLKHIGGSTFVVRLLDSQGQRIEVLANAAGAFDGSRPVWIARPGQYVLDVQTEGTWTAFVEQPRPASAEPPSRMQGQGPAASKFFSLKTGQATFRITYGGTKEFAVWLLDVGGRRVESLAGAMGAFNGSKTVEISRAGVYLLSIEADGSWTVAVEQ